MSERLAQRLRQQSAVAELGRVAIAGGGAAELGAEAARIVADTLGADRCLLCRLDLEAGSALVSDDSAGELGGRRLGLAGTGAERLLRERVPVVLGRPGEEPSRAPAGSAAWACVGRPERPHGLLGVFADRPGAFGEDDAHFLASVANVIAEVVRRERADATLRRVATHDALTGLPNRTLLDDRLHQALAVSRRMGQGVGVLFVDLDRFKLVNESLGHQAGDEVLRAVGDRLDQAVRDSDTVARFGSDEFVVVAVGVADEGDLARVAESLLASLAEPVRAAGREIHVGVSVGMSFAGDAQADAAALMRDAARASTRAKRRGGGSYALLDPEQQRDATDRLRLESELRDALMHGELRLLMQPFVSLQDGRLTGAEALVRWEHPGRGLLGPAEFLDVAEQSGLIVPIGEWVVREACRRTAAWLRSRRREFLLTVNLSARQLVHPGLLPAVRRALEDSRLSPRQLGLELTEHVLVGDEEEAGRSLSELKRLGVRLLLDDFGTGYSSLSHLKRFPIDAVKIDRSFVGGLDQPDGDDAAIVAAILGMSWATGKQVIPEGIETPEQAERLLRMGCELGQGYHFAPPLEPGRFERVVGRDGLVVPPRG